MLPQDDLKVRFGTPPEVRLVAIDSAGSPVIFHVSSPRDPDVLGYGSLRIVSDEPVSLGMLNLMSTLASALFDTASREQLPALYFVARSTGTTRLLETPALRICEVTSRSWTFEATRENNAHTSSSSTVLSPKIRDEIMRLCPFLPCREVFLSTGSPVKRGQYEFLFRAAGINANESSIRVTPPEPQVDGQGNRDEEILVRDPLKRLARFAAKSGSYPLILEDTMLFVEHFNTEYEKKPILPGPDTKRWWTALGSSGLLNLMGSSTRRDATFVCQMGVLTKDGDYSVFRAERRGRIAYSERKPSNENRYFPYVIPHNFHTIFIPEGSEKTYSEMLPGEFRSHDYRADCVSLVTRFLQDEGRSKSDVQSRLF